MKRRSVLLVAMLASAGVSARVPYRDYLPNLPSALPRALETEEEFFSQPHEEEAHFFTKVSKQKYTEALRAAARGSRSHLAMLFESAKFQEGAGAESFADTLFWLLHKAGDKQFSEALRAEPASTRKRVIHLLDFGATYDYSSAFPATFAVEKHEPL